MAALWILLKLSYPKMWSHIHTGESYNQPSNLSNPTALFSRLSSNSAHTHAHTHTESSQMFSISAFGLCWGTRAIRGEFHAITVEQYTQQVSVLPTVAWVLLNILTALLTAAPKQQQEQEEAAACSRKLGKALPESRCFSSARPLLHAKLLESKSVLDYSVTHASSELLWPARTLMCNTVRIRPPAPPHPLGAACSNTPLTQVPPSLPSLSPGRQYDAQCSTLAGVRSISEPVLTRSPVSVLGSNQHFFCYKHFTGCKDVNVKHNETQTHLQSKNL